MCMLKVLGIARKKRSSGQEPRGWECARTRRNERERRLREREREKGRKRTGQRRS